MVELQIVGICIIGLFIFIAAGMPVGIVLIGVGGIGVWLITDNFEAAMHLLSLTAYSVSTTYAYAVVPLFILLGDLAKIAGISKDLFTAAQRYIGHFPGGLGVAATLTCAAFGAVTGSSISTAVAMSRVALPEMRKYGYKDLVSTGIIASAGTLAVMIPPSIMLVIYGILAEQAIGRLLIAGIVPGLVIASLFSIVIVIRTILNPDLGPRGPVFTWKERWWSLVNTVPFLIIALTATGGIVAGIWTPTEAGGS